MTCIHYECPLCSGELEDAECVGCGDVLCLSPGECLGHIRDEDLHARPVVEEGHEGVRFICDRCKAEKYEIVRTEPLFCPACDTTGYVKVKCPCCHDGFIYSSTDPEHPAICTECNRSGVLWVPCYLCEGAGHVPVDYIRRRG